MIIGTTQESLIPKGIKFCQVVEPQCFENEKSSDLVKIVVINPVCIKLYSTSKDNYRPISTLSNFKKLFKSFFFRN